MKKTIIAMVAAALSFLIGCKSVPTPETVANTSNAIGVAVAIVMNQTKISDSDRNVIIDISNIIDSTVKATNTTFEVAWTPIAQRHVNSLIEQKKLTEDQGKLIMSLFTSGAKTLDYVVYKKWPKIGEDLTLVEAATHGFFTGFLKYYRPANATAVTKIDAEYDKTAYEYMMKLTK